MKFCLCFPSWWQEFLYLGFLFYPETHIAIKGTLHQCIKKWLSSSWVSKSSLVVSWKCADSPMAVTPEMWPGEQGREVYVRGDINPCRSLRFARSQGNAGDSGCPHTGAQQEASSSPGAVAPRECFTSLACEHARGFPCTSGSPRPRVNADSHRKQAEVRVCKCPLAAADRDKQFPLFLGKCDGVLGSVVSLTQSPFPVFQLSSWKYSLGSMFDTRN